MKKVLPVLAAAALLAGCHNRYEDSPVSDGFPPATEAAPLETAPTPIDPLQTETPAPAH